MKRTQYRNALEWADSLPEDIREAFYAMLYDLSKPELIEWIMRLNKPEDLQSWVDEIVEDLK